MNDDRRSEFTHAAFHGDVGLCRVDITPPVGIYARNWGAAKHGVADSIHRPLSLTALVLSQSIDSEPLVFIDADLGWWKTPGTFSAFQRRLLDELKLDSARLIFALTHTHAGPPLMQVDASLPGGEKLQQWMQTLSRSAIDAVERARATMFEATLDWHAGRCGLAADRDFPDPDSSRVLCGYHPQSDPDDTLLVGRVTDDTGQIRATLVNYACHPTTLAAENTAISPDYLGAMRETIEHVTSAPALFMLGACGELAPRRQYVGDPEVADQHGRELGYAALAILHGMEPAGQRLVYSGVLESGAPLAIWNHEPRELSNQLRAIAPTVTLPLKDWPSAEELERRRSVCTDRAIEERIRRQRDIRRGLGDGSTFPLPIYAWRIGDAVLVGSCCEPYSLLQRQLRQRFVGRTVICMNLINGSIGYLPPADLYETDVYPVWQTPFGCGALETTIDAMAAAIDDLFGNDASDG